MLRKSRYRNLETSHLDSHPLSDLQKERTPNLSAPPCDIWETQQKIRRVGKTPAPAQTYLRAPLCGLFSLDWRRLCGLRLGLLMMKVPLPWYSAL